MNKFKAFILGGSVFFFFTGQSIIFNDISDSMENSNKEFYSETFKDVNDKDKENGLSAEEELENYKNILKYTFNIDENSYDLDILKYISESESDRDILFTVYILDIHNKEVRGFETNYLSDVKEMKDSNEIYNYLLQNESVLYNFNYYLDKVNTF